VKPVDGRFRLFNLVLGSRQRLQLLHLRSYTFCYRIARAVLVLRVCSPFPMRAPAGSAALQDKVAVAALVLAMPACLPPPHYLPAVNAVTTYTLARLPRGLVRRFAPFTADLPTRHCRGPDSIAVLLLLPPTAT